MVIGKGGETVEQMKQRSGANILISKKDEVKMCSILKTVIGAVFLYFLPLNIPLFQVKIPERVITLVGEVRSNQVALDMILEKVSLTPHFKCKLISVYFTSRLWKIQTLHVA